MITVRHFIDGEWSGSADGAAFARRDLAARPGWLHSRR